MNTFVGMNGKRLPWRIAGSALAWLGAAAMALGADVRGYGVFKTQDYLQASTNAPALQTHWPAYSCSALVQPNGLFTNQVVSASLESPLGFVDPLAAPPAGTDQPFASYYGAFSQADLDALYPTGVYALRITTAHDGNQTLLLNLTTNAFPTNAPHLANFNEAQVVDSFQDFTVRWDAFGGGTSSDFTSFSLADTNGAVVFRTASFGPEPGLTLLNGTNTWIVIPAGRLLPGQTFNGYLFFEKDVVVQTNAYVGARGLVGFAKATSFPLRTVSLAPWLEPLGITSHRFALRLHGSPSKSYIIQSSTNVAGRPWSALVTNIPAGGTFNWTNASTTNPGQEYYRALLQP